MSLRLPLAAVVLAGGRSRRMGRDKATLELAGERLVDRAVRTVGEAFEEVVVVRGHPDRPEIPGLGVRQVTDSIPGQGALGGIHAGLAAIGAPAALVIACDMPLLETDFLVWIGEQLADHQVAVPRGPDGLQPLCAAYHRSCLPVVEDFLARGQRQVYAFYPRVRTRELRLRTGGPWHGRFELFTNVNTPDELAALERRLDGVAGTG